MVSCMNATSAESGFFSFQSYWPTTVWAESANLCRPQPTHNRSISWACVPRRLYLSSSARRPSGENAELQEELINQSWSKFHQLRNSPAGRVAGQDFVAEPDGM